MEQLRPSDYCVVLTTKGHIKQVPFSLDEFIALLSGAANDGEITRVATTDEPLAINAMADTLRAALLAEVDRRMGDLVPPVPDPVPSPDIDAANQRISALETRVAELSDELVSARSIGGTEHPDDEDVAGFASRFAPSGAAAPRSQRNGIDPQIIVDLAARVRGLEQAGMSGTDRHELANLRAEVAALSDVLRQQMAPKAADPVGYVDPRIAAIARVKAAADAKRCRHAVNGDLGLTIKLAEVAQLARNGSEGPMALMRTLGEAQQTSAADAATKAVERSDALARVCIRTLAVETATEKALKQAADDAVDGIADGAIQIIEQIEG